jgi:hypothetical protein
MIRLGLFVMAALGIVLLSIISPQYQWTNGSLTSSMNQTDGFNTITNQSSESDRNETKTQISRPLQNSANHNSNLSSSVPAQAASNLIITTPDEEEQLQENQGNQIPIIQPFVQPVQQPEVVSSPPLYQQQPSVIQSQLALQPQIISSTLFLSRGTFSYSTLTEPSIFDFYLHGGTFSHPITTTLTKCSTGTYFAAIISLSSQYTCYTTIITT